MSNPTSRVTVVGSLNADHRVHVAHIPKPGETILASDLAVASGGKGANQAVRNGRGVEDDDGARVGGPATTMRASH